MPHDNDHSSTSTVPNAASAGRLSLGDAFSVNRLGFGAMRITGEGVFGPPPDRDECRRVLRRALDLGVDFIDTADSYGPAVSEEIIAEALHPYPAGLVIATKAGFERPGPGRWTMNGRPEHLRRACEGSLKRLRVERIDLFQLHRIDPAVPEADQFGTLAELRDEGKIRLVGLSEVDVPAIERARATLPIVSVQNRYNIAERAWQAVVDYCERERIAFLPWYPLGAGSMKVPAAVQQVADRRGATPLQVALAWLLASSPIMLPIPGTSKVPHLEQNVAAASLQLTPDEMRELEQVQTG
jgi:aryl-alcohol dehydrogenase-like predicted oxidoreductase